MLNDAFYLHLIVFMPTHHLEPNSNELCSQKTKTQKQKTRDTVLRASHPQGGSPPLALGEGGALAAQLVEHEGVTVER